MRRRNTSNCLKQAKNIVSTLKMSKSLLYWPKRRNIFLTITTIIGSIGIFIAGYSTVETDPDLKNRLVLSGLSIAFISGLITPVIGCVVKIRDDDLMEKPVEPKSGDNTVGIELSLQEKDPLLHETRENAEEERVRKAEEERVRKAEEERVRKAEEERVRKAEEERVRKAEEERAREAEEERARNFKTNLEEAAEDSEYDKLIMFLNDSINVNEARLVLRVIHSTISYQPAGRNQHINPKIIRDQIKTRQEKALDAYCMSGIFDEFRAM
jgi:hypothetical protein